MKSRILKAGLSGLAGAVTLTILHQVLKRTSRNAPHMDAIGMNALSGALAKVKIDLPDEKSLYYLTMVGDIVSNTFYYATTSTSPKKITATVASGLMAGVGAVTLPGMLHLGGRNSNRTTSTKIMTVFLYLSGSVATAVTYRLLDNFEIK